MVLKTPAPTIADNAETTDSGDADAPLTRAFIETLFASLREDLKQMKTDIAQEIREVRRDVDFNRGQS